MNLHDIYSDIIKEHSLSGHNKHPIDNADISVPGNNPSCGDSIQLEIAQKDNTIQDAGFTGVGCAISQASASIMIDLIRGKSLDEAKKLSNLFISMVQRTSLSEEELESLEDAAALQNISNMPARVKCATMPWHTLKKAIDDLEKE